MAGNMAALAASPVLRAAASPVLPEIAASQVALAGSCGTSGWRPMDQGAFARQVSPTSGSCAVVASFASECGHSGEPLQLALQERKLVLYDRRSNQAFVRHLSEEQAVTLSVNQQRYCPLCRQPLNASWAFVVEGYWEMLSSLMTSANVTSSSPFTSNEEAAATCGLHSIPIGLLNCGYYAHFFVEGQKLGAGSFGAVYLCRHVMDEIELGVFAVKKLALGDDAKRLRQVVREVKALERLRHMNIIDYKHSWLEVDRHSEVCPYVPFLYILMEFCNYGSLEDMIWPDSFVRGATDNVKKSARLTEEVIWRLFLDICRGLHHLHSRSILHRDLKPSNILLHLDEADEKTAGSVPRALLSDFGACEILSEGHTKVDGGYAVEFVAPERLRGEESDEPADIWSAGLVMYAMCYGDLPYHSADPVACRAQVMAHTILSEPENFRDDSLWRLISALTAREQVVRPTAREAERMCFVGMSREQEKHSSATCGEGNPALPDLPAAIAASTFLTTPASLSMIKDVL